MADWLTHVLIAWTAVEILSLKFPRIRRFRGVALVGAIIPDLNNFTLLMGETGSHLSEYLVPVQTPVGVVLVVLALAFLGKRESRKMTFGLLFLGAYLHVAGDFLIKTLWGKVMPFFPFSFELYGVGIFEQGGWLFPLIAGILAVTSTGLRRLSSRKVDRDV